MKTRRQINEAAFRKARKAQARIKRVKSFRSKEYREWIATLPCCVLAAETFPGFTSENLALLLVRGRRNYPQSDCAHVGYTGRGASQKCDDRETVPLSRLYHNELDHGKAGRAGFEKRYRLNLLELAAELRKVYGGEKP